MNKTILVAGAASALMFGAVAIAQTTSSGAADPNMQGQTGSAATGAMSTDRAAGADAYGADTAAQSGATNAGEFGDDAAGTVMDRAGERG